MFVLKRLYKGILKQLDKVYYSIKPCFSWVLSKINGVEDINPYDIPIIINNRNRYSCLKRLIKALEVRGYKNIYIIDNDSTYPPLLEYYRKEYPYKLIKLGKNVGHMSLWRTGIIDQFRNNYFVYTDPDVVPIDECPSDFMQYFLGVFKKHPFVEKVGFALRIDDIPSSYGKKEDVLRWERQFWNKKISHGDNSIYKAAIDTTFALYRPMFIEGGFLGSPHIRTGYPYEAMHLPWYNDSSILDDEEKYYIDHCETPSHWSRGDVWQ